MPKRAISCSSGGGGGAAAAAAGTVVAFFPIIERVSGKVPDVLMSGQMRMVAGSNMMRWNTFPSNSLQNRYSTSSTLLFCLVFSF